MDFLNDLGKRFSSVARSVSEKTKDSVESSRLASDLRLQKNALEQLYTELGKLCYDLRLGQGDEDQMEKVFSNIQRTRERIEALTAQRDAIRDVRRCPSCGAVVSKEARFCSACGKRLPEDAPVPEEPGPPTWNTARTAAPSATARTASAPCAASPSSPPLPPLPSPETPAIS